MNILDKIIARKQQEVSLAKQLTPIAVLEKSIFFEKKVNSISHSLKAIDSSGIIAEHKRKSPSKGIINDKLTLEFVTNGYAAANAAAFSILTDTVFFGGSPFDLMLAKQNHPNKPMIRKDFIIDEYQIIEAKAWGGDVILLIAANLEVKKCEELAQFAKSLGLEVLLEVHNLEELHHYISPFVNLVGVNNRNLKNFEVSIQTSLDLAAHIPNEFLKVAESGLTSAKEIKILKQAGFKGFLIGESFMKTDNPGEECKKLIAEI